MQCEDTSKLRTPLNEVCMTTDIGCVPIVTGKPTCSPQPDELPIAYDRSTSTLWLFSCDTREWLAFGKFSICQLSALNLDNIRNICDVLNIAVNYGGSGECVQGTVTLGELAQRILECLQLETKIVTIGQGEGNKVKISIDGLPLDPVYVTGRNIWSEGGSGTEADPLKVATYDPICKWPVKTQAQVDAASVKHLGACIDGQMSRVPYPKQEQVKVCEADQLTLEQARAKGSALTLVGCDNGNVVRIPVSQSGFFDRDYICVPSVTARPSGAPLTGTGPLRIGCNGELYVWLCEESRWVEVRFNPNALDGLNPSAVSDLCNNFRMMGWYSNTSGDPCMQEVKFTLKQLVQMLRNCEVTDSIKVLASNVYYKHCIDFNRMDAGAVYRGRDMRIIIQNGDFDRINVYGTPLYMTINVRNDFSPGVKGLLNIHVRGLVRTMSLPLSMNMIISDVLDINFAHAAYETSEGNFTTPAFANGRMENGLDPEGQEYPPNYRTAGGVMATLNEVIPNGVTKTFYVQYFLIFGEEMNVPFSTDLRCSVDAILYPIKEV